MKIGDQIELRTNVTVNGVFATVKGVFDGFSKDGFIKLRETGCEYNPKYYEIIQEDEDELDKMKKRLEFYKTIAETYKDITDKLLKLLND